MAYQKQSFSQWEPKVLKSLVPDGDFHVRCTGKRWQRNEGKNRYLQLDLTILDPDYGGLTLVGQCTDGAGDDGKLYSFIPNLIASYLSGRNPTATPEQITTMVRGMEGYEDDWFLGADLWVRTKRGSEIYEDRSDVRDFIQRSAYELGCVTDEKGRHGRRNMKSLEQQPGTSGGFNPAGTPKGLPKGAGGPVPSTPPPGQIPPPSQIHAHMAAAAAVSGVPGGVPQTYMPATQAQPQPYPPPYYQPAPPPTYQPPPAQITPPPYAPPPYAPPQTFAPPSFTPPNSVPPAAPTPGAPPIQPSELDAILKQAGLSSN